MIRFPKKPQTGIRLIRDGSQVANEKLVISSFGWRFLTIIEDVLMNLGSKYSTKYARFDEKGILKVFQQILRFNNLESIEIGCFTQF